MRRAYSLPALAVVILLAGCGDSGARAYYRSRYIPTDVEASYRSVERQQWSGDPDVYELPAAVPALDGEHYARRECAVPGPRFKPQPIVGTHDEVRGSSDPTLQDVGGWDPRPVPLGPIGPDTRYRISAQSDAPPSGLPQRAFGQPASGWDRRPAPKRGPNQIDANPIVGMRDPAKDDYCLPPAIPALPRDAR